MTDEPKYVQGQHLPDCPSQRPGEIRTEGGTVTLDLYVCTGCLPLP